MLTINVLKKSNCHGRHTAQKKKKSYHLISFAEAWTFDHGPKFESPSQDQLVPNNGSRICNNIALITLGCSRKRLGVEMVPYNKPH